jgi:hypothetical protein
MTSNIFCVIMVATAEREASQSCEGGQRRVERAPRRRSRALRPARLAVRCWSISGRGGTAALLGRCSRRRHPGARLSSEGGAPVQRACAALPTHPAMGLAHTQTHQFNTSGLSLGSPPAHMGGQSSQGRGVNIALALL